MERRKFPRFAVELKIEARAQGRESAIGKTNDFSRDGLMAVFDRFDFQENMTLDLLIQRPNLTNNILASAQPLWKKFVDGKCIVGFQFGSFAPEDKIEILEYAYSNWLKEKISVK